MFLLRSKSNDKASAPPSDILVRYATKLKVDPGTLASDESDALAADQPLDLSHPLPHYYISSSHNTYLSGNQVYGKATALAYQRVLEHGCRCVEIDVWDGEVPASFETIEDEVIVKPHEAINHGIPSKWHPARVEPRVLHGYTATKEVPFRDVIETIGTYAFTTTDLPLIISLELHTSRSQQAIMVEIMHQYLRDYLVQPHSCPPDVVIPTLDALKGKILVKTKYSSPPSAQGPSLNLPATTRDDDASDNEESQSVSVSKGKIIPELGSMGLYTRSTHFTSFDQPEAKLPTHVFSLSESKFASALEKSPTKLLAHNKDFLLRAYPKGTRVNSSNLDPAPFWRLGVQMAALNWQYLNEPVMLNHAMFHGTGGWVLKPPGLLGGGGGATASLSRVDLDLVVEVFAAQGLRKEVSRPYVKCELHVEDEDERAAAGLPVHGGDDGREGQVKAKTPQAGKDGDFKGCRLDFKGVRDVVEDLTFVRFKVMDDEVFSRDELVSWACIRLPRLRDGVRLVHLFDEDGQETDGRLLVRITKTLTKRGGQRV